MLTIGIVLLVIAGILAVVGFGVMGSPIVGSARIAFYFVLLLSLSVLAYGIIQTEVHVDPRVPVQRTN